MEVPTEVDNAALASLCAGLRGVSPRGLEEVLSVLRELLPPDSDSRAQRLRSSLAAELLESLVARGHLEERWLERATSRPRNVLGLASAPRPLRRALGFAALAADPEAVLTAEELAREWERRLRPWDARAEEDPEPELLWRVRLASGALPGRWWGTEQGPELCALLWYALTTQVPEWPRARERRWEPVRRLLAATELPAGALALAQGLTLWKVAAECGCEVPGKVRVPVQPAWPARRPAGERFAALPNPFEPLWALAFTGVRAVHTPHARLLELHVAPSAAETLRAFVAG